MNKLLANLICLLFFSTRLLCQTNSNSLLEKDAPNLKFEKILNYDKESADLFEYKGKIVILDFWATWCAPCLKSFPHLESLQSEFPEDLQVITVTSDNHSRINKFLTKFQTGLPIVIDTTRTIAKHFPHRSIPHTVVLDKIGTIKMITTPEKITKEHIKNILLGKSVQVKEKKDNLDFDPKKHLLADNAIFQFTITPYQEGSAMWSSFNNGRLFFFIFGLNTLHEKVRGFPFSTRTIWDVKDKSKYRWSKQNAYCLELIAPYKTEEEVLEFILDYVNNNFRLKSRVEKRKTLVKVLRRTNFPLKLKEANLQTGAETSMSGRGFKASNTPIERLAEYLEEFKIVDNPVIDETGLTGNYEIDIPFYEEDPDNIYIELEKVGLELINAEREINMLILYEYEVP